MSGTELVRYDAMCRAIAEAHAVDEVKDIRDKALAIEVYARQAKNVENERRACEIRLRAERKCGQLLAEMEKAKASPGNQYTGKLDRSTNASGPKTLSDLGITYDQSSKWQQLAKVPDDKFEKELAGEAKPSTNGIISSQKAEGKPPKVTPVANDALWLWGRLRDFERDGFLTQQQDAVLRTMTPEMLDDTLRLAPVISAWLDRLGETL